MWVEHKIYTIDVFTCEVEVAEKLEYSERFTKLRYLSYIECVLIKIHDL